MALEIGENSRKPNSYISRSLDRPSFYHDVLTAIDLNQRKGATGLDDHDGFEVATWLDQLTIIPQFTMTLPFHFLGLPLDIRLIIYRIVLVKNSYVNVISSWSKARTAMQQSTTYVDFPIEGPGSGPAKGWSTNILQACRQVYQEAIGILYGQNHFRTAVTVGFANAFIRDPVVGIGIFNSALIRQVSLTIPGFVCTNVDRRLRQFIPFVICGLPNLYYLMLRSKIHAYCPVSKWPYSPYHEYRNEVLYTAAWTLVGHPSLRRATWFAPEVNQFPQKNDEDSDSDENPDANPDDVQVCTSVLLTSSYAKCEMHPCFAEDLLLDRVGSKEVVLDCLKIRSTPWDYLYEYIDRIQQTGN